MTAKPKVALIAGVGDGLGGAIARRFARGDYATVLVARSADRLARIADDIQAEGGRGIAYVADLREETAVTELFADVEKELGLVSVAVFNSQAMCLSFGLDNGLKQFAANKIADLLAIGNRPESRELGQARNAGPPSDVP